MLRLKSLKLHAFVYRIFLIEEIFHAKQNAIVFLIGVLILKLNRWYDSSREGNNVKFLGAL
ncbi:hypothetical protein [Bartonella sp. AU55XJBT]|uniref:hypothetical protein n=1 Tax=Bartonella sp. AU55XJBT TaxID=3019091 RepID=UPI00236104DC|nr:hypothetical protein [Bartonella sp. AU55XJBT]